MGEHRSAIGVTGELPLRDQMPFLVTPEGKVLAQSTTLMKYICKQGGTLS